MKNILLLLLSNFVLITNAKSQITKFKTIQTAVYSIYKKPLITSSEFLVTLDLDKKKIHFYGREESDYDLAWELGNWKDKSGATHGRFKALNKAGTECILEIILFDSQNMNVRIEFEDYNYVYKMKRTD